MVVLNTQDPDFSAQQKNKDFIKLLTQGTIYKPDKENRSPLIKGGIIQGYG